MEENERKAQRQAKGVRESLILLLGLDKRLFRAHVCRLGPQLAVLVGES